MLAVISLMTAGVFALDVTIPLGHVVWLLYLLPLWLSARLESPTAPRRYALLCTLLFGIGFSLAPPGVDVRTALFNRALGTGMVWGQPFF